MKKRFGYFSLSIVIVFSVLFGMILAGSIGRTPAVQGSQAAPVESVEQAQKSSPPGMQLPSFGDIAEKCNPAVVTVVSTDIVKMPRNHMMDPFMWFFSPEERERFRGSPERDREGEEEIPQQSGGSGFIISKDGYILTNNHVVEKADKVEVILNDDEKYQAKVIGKDPETDIALIKIDVKEDLPTITLGDSERTRVGDWVMAIGNPYQLSHTVTVGVVSAKGRRLTNSSFDDFIQTDAAINFGNSGGPLVNLRGEAVGINTALSARGQNIGFAVPINLAKNILTDLKAEGRAVRGFLGIKISNITDDLVEALNLPGKEGVLVQSVEKGMPADKAGVKKGDVILEVSGRKINTSDELVGTISSFKPDSVAELLVLRDGKRQTMEARLSERPLEGRAGVLPEKEPGEEGSQPGKLGLSIQNLTTETRRYFEIPSDEEGVVVAQVKPTSAAAEAGLRRGDLITEVNRRKVTNTTEFKDALEKSRNVVLFYVLRGGDRFFVPIKIKE
jgi:serine protease Do